MIPTYNSKYAELRDEIDSAHISGDIERLWHLALSHLDRTTRTFELLTTPKVARPSVPPDNKPIRELYKYEYDLLDYIGDLHAYCTGVCDGLSFEDAEQVAEVIRRRFECWEHSSLPYDAVVYALCYTVLKEWGAHYWAWGAELQHKLTMSQDANKPKDADLESKDSQNDRTTIFCIVPVS